MIARTAALFALGATTALAQLSIPDQIGGLSFSGACKQALVEVVTDSDFSQCVPITALVPAFSNNMSIVPYLDGFMSDVCYMMPCANSTLERARDIVLSGCTSDLQNEGLSTSVVTDAFAAYPLVRELLCTKTTNYYTAESYGGFLGAPAIPITPQTYNSTDGYFCVTSLLTQLSAYFGANLTVPYIASAIEGQNQRAVELFETINPNILCNDCIFAGLSLIEEAYPAVADVQLSTIAAVLGQIAGMNASSGAMPMAGTATSGMAMPTMATMASVMSAAGMPSVATAMPMASGTVGPAPGPVAPGTGMGSMYGLTLNGFVNATCAYQGMAVPPAGELPSDVKVSIVDSTFPSSNSSN